MEEAPSGEEAFRQVALAWLLRLDVREYLHPAMQAALQGAYKGEHLEGGRGSKSDFAECLLGSAFYHNYDEYYMLVWNSNLKGREKIQRDFPQKNIPPEGEDLNMLYDTVPQALRDQVEDLVSHRAHLPAIIRRPEHVSRLKQQAREEASV